MSTDETTAAQEPATLWGSVVYASSRVLACLDYAGEQLAWFFGLTESRYQYYVDEALRQEEEMLEAEEIAQQEENARVMQLEASKTSAASNDDLETSEQVAMQETNAV